MKNFLYTVSEFFYDRSFNDYDQTFTRDYILTYKQKIGGLICPTKIVVKENIFVFAHKPESITYDINDIIGTFAAKQDRIGVYGQHILDVTLANRILDIFGRDNFGSYKISPFGVMLFDQNSIPLEFILSGVYLNRRNQ